MPEQLDLVAALEKERRGLAAGLVRKEAAQAGFESENREWFARARDLMAALALHKEVSSDDVWSRCPPPSHAHPSIMGSIFSGDDRFVAVGRKQTTRATGHARWITTYALKGVLDDGKA